MRTDGTWTSGDGVAHAGRKLAQLVRLADNHVVASSGGGQVQIDGVAIQVYVRTDVDYLQATVPLYADGSWSATGNLGPGARIARLVRTDTGRTINSSEWNGSPGYQGLVRSFAIPQDDPDYGYDGSDGGRRAGYRTEQRSWIYDDAVAALAFIQSGEPERAGTILAALEPMQSADGSLPFSLDVYLGRVAEDYRRAGALAWLGTSALEYDRATGSTRFQPFARRVAEYLLSLQVTTGNGFEPADPRYGGILGGEGRYDAGYVYNSERVEFIATEHNIDAYFFLRDFGSLSGDRRYVNAANLVKQCLLTKLWSVAQQRFLQGISPDGPDDGQALDLGTWGGLFLLAVGRRDLAEQALQYAEQFRIEGQDVAYSSDAGSYNQRYATVGPISGYRPYLGPDYPDPPSTVWSEGTWGAILLKQRLGLDVTSDIASMHRMQAADADGGYVQVSQGRRALPYEFHVWPSVAATGWAAIVEGGASVLWREDPAHVPTSDLALLQAHAPVLRYDQMETFRADAVGEITDNHVCCDEDGSNDVLHGADGEVVARADGVGADALSIPLLATRSGQIDSGGDRIDERNAYEEDAQRLHAESHYADRLYARRVPLEDGSAILQYWFFYYDNPKTYFGIGAHEGDWEMVQIHLDPSGNPQLAAYSQHKGGERCEWQHVQRSSNGRPIVYVAEGSHASYFSSGYHFNGGADDTASGTYETSAFTIIDIADLASEAWLMWRGQWGGSDASPHSPAYQGKKWDDPAAWAAGVDSCTEDQTQ